MRDKIIQGLNALLDTEHDTLHKLYMEPIELSESSCLLDHKLAYKELGKAYITGLDMIGILIDGKPIVAECEDGIIQRFL